MSVLEKGTEVPHSEHELCVKSRASKETDWERLYSKRWHVNGPFWVGRSLMVLEGSEERECPEGEER